MRKWRNSSIPLRNVRIHLVLVLKLTIYRLKSKSYQLELTNFNAQHPLEYIVMGSRKSDPGCSKLGEIATSDVHKGYPNFTRINPLI